VSQGGVLDDICKIEKFIDLSLPRDYLSGQTACRDNGYNPPGKLDTFVKSVTPVKADSGFRFSPE